MRTKRTRIQVHVDRYTRVVLTVIAVLLTLLAVGLWAERPEMTDRATAAEKFGNSFQQVHVVEKNTAKTNDKLDELIKLLKSGDVKVRLIEGEKPPRAGGKNGGK